MIQIKNIYNFIKNSKNKYFIKVILDEADKMIDMGFEEDVNFIMDSI